MPTQHVEPESHDHLQDVANALFKARKVVVVTGAGISTNSGIPDFRSENGLYSLIQAQFDAASQHARQSERTKIDNVIDDGEGERSSKRRRISRENSPDPSDISQRTKGEIEVRVGTTCVEPELPPMLCNSADTEQPKPATDSDALDEPVVSTPRPKLLSLSMAQPTTSPLSSPPAEEFLIPPSSLRPGPHKHLAHISLARGSSPLSSPPSGLFDASPPDSPSEESISRRSSTTPSEIDESQTSNSFSASQASNPGKINLPNMKGKDLFDASIWSDPTRTSVFYKFATSLRQKVRDAEPTSSHKFISHLRDRGKLVRCYTQNIDQIEEKVGLSTSLLDGPGSRGRFSRRSTANMSQLSKMVEEATGGDNSDAASSDKPSQSGNESNQQSQTDASDDSSPPHQVNPKADEPESSQSDQGKAVPLPKRELPRSGVECVFLHGSLQLLRCFLCGQLCSWDDDDRVMETLSGQQPECPHCVGATEARREKGKRALGVGKLRPDIVLYGEEHPNAHLISPIVTHDLALYPDMLLILGTSLRVHGLKVMVREFAKTVHSKGGKVVFVNFTKPPESSWGDIIDYWVQWDCDAWVGDLQVRIPKLWQAPEPPKAKKKRDSGGVGEENAEDKKKSPAANPVALRDTKVTGAYCTLKILRELHRITGKPPPPPTQRRASIAVVNPSSITTDSTIQVVMDPLQKVQKARPKRPRKSAPGALEKPKRTSSTLNPNHGRNRKQGGDVTQDAQPSQPIEPTVESSSILDSVKKNPRLRKRKMIDGEEVYPIGKRNTSSQGALNKADLKLPPLRPEPNPVHEKPPPLEPTSPPTGPLSPLSPNRRAARAFHRPHTFFLQDSLLYRFGEQPYSVNLGEQNPGKQHWWPPAHHAHHSHPTHHVGKAEAEASAAVALAGMRMGSPVVNKFAFPMPMPQDLISWASSWKCPR